MTKVVAVKAAALRGVVLALVVAAAVALAARPAAADSFPLATFKIVNTYSGSCATANFQGSDLVGPAPCSALNLYQQWTWNPVNDQLVNVGTGRCAQAYGSGGVSTAPCQNISEQLWQRYPYNGGYRIARVDGFDDEGWYYYEPNQAFKLDYTYDAPNDRFTFTMPLL